MPSYYLYVQDGDGRIEDPNRFEIGDLETALDEALQGAREIVADAVRSGRAPHGSRIVVVDENSHEVGSVRFAEVVPEGLR